MIDACQKVETDWTILLRTVGESEYRWLDIGREPPPYNSTTHGTVTPIPLQARREMDVRTSVSSVATRTILLYGAFRD